MKSDGERACEVKLDGRSKGRNGRTIAKRSEENVKEELCNTDEVEGRTRSQSHCGKTTKNFVELVENRELDALTRIRTFFGASKSVRRNVLPLVSSSLGSPFVTLLSILLLSGLVAPTAGLVENRPPTILQVSMVRNRHSLLRHKKIMRYSNMTK